MNQLALMHKLRNQIAANSAFDGVPFPIIHTLIDNARIIQLDAHQALFRAGDIAESVYMILSGSLTIHANGQLIARRRSNEWVGEQAVIDSMPRSADAQVESTAILAVFSSSSFLNSLKQSPLLCLNFLRSVSSKLRQSTVDRGLYYAREHALLRSVKARTADEAFRAILSDFWDNMPEITDSPEPISPREEFAVVIITDIRSFTTISERHSLPEMQQFLNAYFSHVASIFKRNGLYIDKYMGDGVLAYGLSVIDDRCCEHAVRVAIELVSANSNVLFEPVGRIETGVGVHYGKIIIGDFGSADRLEYTIIGDPVNVANRLQEQTKNTSSCLLISVEVRDHLSEGTRLRFEEEGKFINVRNRARPVKCYQLLDIGGG